MIRLKAVSKSFGAVAILRAANLELGRGERVGVVGASGCGKTTLLRLIAGLELPDSGELYLAGRLASGGGCFLLPHLRGIGFAFQEPTLWPHMTVAQNILFGVSGSRREKHARLEQLLEATGLGGLGGRRPAQLSLGQARRVNLARALAPAPAILLLDEPLTNLDAELHARMLRLISAEQQESGATLLYVSHAPEELKALCTKVYTMADGGLQL